MKTTLVLALSAFAFLSCSSTVNKIFGEKRTPHEAYAKTIETYPDGKQWLAVSRTVLSDPQTIQLPYSHLGQFPAAKPRALALEFKAKQGEWINFKLENGSESVAIYSDVYEIQGTDTIHILAADTANQAFGFEVTQSGKYLLRLQPPLDKPVEYNLSASILPSLGFPVAGTKARVGSVWGDSRDGGKRRHEGIDIFAAKRTPVIAAADGYITRVNDGGLGGKTVNLKVENRNLSLYYAHLDQQLVSQGQRVKKGDTLGLVGNTGNAKHTPPHLHFGIYTYGGPVDPLPFVNNVSPKQQPVTAKNLPGSLKLTRPIITKNKETIGVNTVLVPLALSPRGYIAELPDGNLVEAPLKTVKAVAGTESKRI